MLKSEIKGILKKPTWQVIIAAITFYVLGLYLFSHFVWSTDIYEYNYSGKTGFEDYIDMIRRIDFMRYLLSPLYVLLIAGTVSGLIQIGLIGNNIKINYKLLFKIVLTATFILFLPFWVKTVWFVLIKGSYTMEEVKLFYPLSVLSFVDRSELHEFVIKALGRISIFQFVFMAFIAWCISFYCSNSFTRLMGIVLYTYGLGFLLFQTIQILIFI